MLLTPQERYVLSILVLVKKNSIGDLTKIHEYFINKKGCPAPTIKDMRKVVNSLKEKELIDDYHTATPRGLIEVGNSRLLTIRQILYLYHKGEI